MKSAERSSGRSLPAVGGFLLAVAPWAGALLAVRESFEQSNRGYGRDKIASVLFLIGLLTWLLPGFFGGSMLVQDVGQVLLLVLLWFFARRLPFGGPEARSAFIVGVVFGLGTIAAFSLAGMALSDGRVSGWTAHPNIWAGLVLVPALAVAILDRKAWWTSAALLLAAVTIIAAGSRGAALALLLAAVIVPATWQARKFLVLLLLAGLAGASALFIQPRFFSGVSSVLDRGSSVTATGNLLAGPPQRLGVELKHSHRVGELTESFTLRKVESYSWARLQYPVLLFPDTSYTFSGEIDPREGTVPGLLGVGTGANRSKQTARIVKVADTWHSETQGQLRTRLATTRTEDGWMRFEWTVKNESPQLVRWWVGPSPFLAEGGVGTELEVRKLQAVVGEEAPGYTLPNKPPLEAVQFLDRFRAYRVAISGFLEAPLFGNSAEFASYYRHNPPDQRTVVASHAHNLVLATLYDRGLVGTLGLFLVLVALVARDPRFFAPVVVAVLVSNTFDLTLWSSNQLYALVFFSGVSSCIGSEDPDDSTGDS